MFLGLDVSDPTGTDLNNLMVNYFTLVSTEDSLRTLFQPFGTVENVKIVHDKITGVFM